MYPCGIDSHQREDREAVQGFNVPT